jgi:two-component system chemotaxis response regulator CheB
MAKKDIVVIGASAGGMQALEQVVAGLPLDYAGSIFIVWHLAPGVESVLPSVLQKLGPLPAAHPQDGDAIAPGRLYVAPPDHHMLLERGYIRVTRGPKENRFRPAVDPLFRSAAYVYGTRAVGVVLSGALDDGTSGLWVMKLRGSTTVVQEPADALYRSMPINALDSVAVDYRLPAAKIGALLGRLAHEEAPAPLALPERQRKLLEHEVKIAAEHEALEERVMDYGELSAFTCPECHGVLTLLKEGRIVRFRCHTGHAYSSDTLLQSTTELAEARLWDAVRALDETVMLLSDLGRQFARAGNTKAAEFCFDRAREAHQRSQPIREAANANDALSADELRGGEKKTAKEPAA